MPKGMGYGTYKEKGVRNASAKPIPPKGIAQAGQNGKPPSRTNDKPFALPPSNSSPDYGAAKPTVASGGGGTGSKPKRTADKSKKIAAPKVGQRMREFNTRRGTGTSRKVKKA